MCRLVETHEGDSTTKPIAPGYFILILVPAMAAVLVTLVSSSAAWAGEFSVQIGAFRDAPSGFAEAAKTVGPLLTTETTAGVIWRFTAAPVSAGTLGTS